MTTEEIRHLPYLSWRDPLAWIESMRGKRWNTLLRQESSLFNKLLANPNIQKLIPVFEKEFEYIYPFTSQESFSIGCGSILITIQKSDVFLWRWKWEKTPQKEAFDIDICIANDTDYIWYTAIDRRHGSSEYDIVILCENIKGNIIWRKSRVSSDIAVKNGRCYYITVSGVFDTVALCSCDAYSGKDEKTLYTNTNVTHTLVLSKEANRTLYLKSVEASKSLCWRIDDDNIIQLDTDTDIQIPLGICSGEDCRIVRKSGSKQFELRGKEIENWKLPNVAEVPEWISLQTGHIQTINTGSHTIWKCGVDHPPIQVFSILAGDLYPNPWSAWDSQSTQTVHVQSPHEPPYSIHIVNTNVIKERISNNIPKHAISELTVPLIIHKYHTSSFDGTRVPYILVHYPGFSPGEIRGLLVSGYGAYGLSTVVGWPHQGWYPILKRGWAIAYAFVRGGGDVDDDWANMARLENRHLSIEDFESVIRDSQKKTGVSPDKTVIYGRSAGGFLVGAVTLRNPAGTLFGATYTEVPFVDILRTLTNPILPLTKGEYDDFGNPATSLPVFRTMMNISPVNAMPLDGIPYIFVLARTGLKDQQVLAYEPFKWILKLRGKPESPSGIIDAKQKFIAFEKNQAHVYSIQKSFQARAVDLAILETWLLKKIAPISIVLKMAHVKSAARKSRKSGGRRSTARRTEARKSGGSRSTARRTEARKSGGRRSTARRTEARKSGGRRSTAREH